MRIQHYIFSFNNVLKDKFAYYLTGLIEGDGTIIVPKRKIQKVALTILEYK